MELVVETLRVAGHELELARPRRPEDLIDEHAFADDEYLPYWAELWPSALALADAVAGTGVAGRRVIELGCGLGLPSLAAAAGGADVLATDWSAEAVRSAAANARRNELRLSTAVWRWTGDPAGLAPPFDLVLASDLLYERRNGPWLLGALESLMAPDGEAWLADPGRSTAAAFFDSAEGSFAIDPISHGGPEAVTVHRLRRR